MAHSFAGAPVRHIPTCRAHEARATAAVVLPYVLVCALAGLVIGWIPGFFHGPIPEKFDYFGLRGAIAVWTWYTARMLIGLMVGITSIPERWWVRGPLCGFLMILPPGIMSLATPTCGPMCMFWNEVTGTIAGLLVGGIAFVVTGKQHARDAGPAEVADREAA
jgi:hypothetical protein